MLPVCPCSCRYLVETTAHMLGKPLDKVNVITCHLGEQRRRPAQRSRVATAALCMLGVLLCGDSCAACLIMLHAQGLHIRSGCTHHHHDRELVARMCCAGNGSSITAVKNGVSVDTSMGMTPLEG